MYQAQHQQMHSASPHAYPPSRGTMAQPAVQPPHPLAIPPNASFSYASGSNIPPQSPSQSSEPNDESNYNLPPIPPVSRVWEGLAFALKVVQQPLRARMCGFGDKDRRPLSPPPCVKLLIIDTTTGQEIDYEKVADLSKLVLNVDLWDLKGEREDNCVRNNTTSPAISATSTIAYPAATAGPSGSMPQLSNFDITSIPAYAPQNFPSTTGREPASATPVPGQDGYGPRARAFPYPADPRYNGQYPNGYDPNFAHRGSAHASIPSSTAPLRSARSSQDLGPHNESGTVARNLLGQLSTSVSRLVDEEGKVGLWFVLQDLSVRSEGWFRLKFMLFSLAQLMMAEEENAGNSPPELLSEASCLAMVFSNPFKVFSAKKFPGVIETTALSRKFARQGIKIPIRKDGHNKKKRDGQALDGDHENGMDDDDDGEELYMDS